MQSKIDVWRSQNNQLRNPGIQARIKKKTHLHSFYIKDQSQIPSTNLVKLHNGEKNK